MNSLLSDAAVLRILDPAVKRVVIGLSGGVDSVSLTHAVSGLETGKPLVALHVNHGLMESAARFEEAALAVCERLAIRLETMEVEVAGRGSLETAAREARYGAFEAYLEPGDLLLLAHHLDDQLETALFRQFRGSGKPGLDGMPRQRPVGEAHLFRPLLDLPRHDILEYARDHELSWAEDASNADLSHDRNYIRHRVIPAIEERWPDIRQRISDGLARDQRMRDVAAGEFSRVLSKVLSPAGSLDLSTVRTREPDELSDLLRAWIHEVGAPLPSGSLIDEVASMVRQDARVDMAGSLVEFREFDNHLYLLRPLPGCEGTEFDLKPGQTEVPGGRIYNDIVKGKGLCQAEYSIRFRQGGESLRLRHKRSLKNLFQEGRLPPWLRDRLPLIYHGDELVALAAVPGWHFDMVIAEGWQAGETESGLEISLELDDLW